MGCATLMSQFMYFVSKGCGVVDLQSCSGRVVALLSCKVNCGSVAAVDDILKQHLEHLLKTLCLYILFLYSLSLSLSLSTAPTSFLGMDAPLLLTSVSFEEGY